MSLVGTLGKIAMGVAAAKVASSVMKGGGLGGALGGNRQGGGGGLAGGLGSLLGGGAMGQGQNQQGGGLGGLLGGQSQQGGAGGLGGLLDSLGGGAGGGQAGGGLGGLLNAQLNGQQMEAPAAPEQEEEAKILIRAMLNAAKCDGEFDAAEQEKIVKQIGDIDQEDAEFINQEVSKPLNTQEFIASVPRGMEQQVYLMSLMAIDLDSQAEAQYLDQLCKGFNISQQQSNDIHAKLGVPALYG